MALFLLFAASILLAATAHHVPGQEGFLSIDCGLDAAFSGRMDTYTDIPYESDDPYVDGGENHEISTDQQESGLEADLLTLRSFPTGTRNCYALPAQSGAKYLLRMQFLHGHYDGNKSSSPVQFDLYLGTNYWDTVQNGSYWWSEAVFAAWASWVPVCLLNTGRGTPFVNTLELRKLEDSLYQDVTADLSMSTFERINLGANTTTRYPDDPYDRFWWRRASSSWAYISTQSPIVQLEHDSFDVPVSVLQRAATAVGNDTVLNVLTWEGYKASLMFKVFLHFADFQKSQLRQFDIYFNDQRLDNYSPTYLTASSVQSSGWSKSPDGVYNITLAANNVSVLPPMMSAYEIYSLIPHHTQRTFSKDFDTMMSIKHEYGVIKNWMGDPCFPVQYAWSGVKCSNTTDNITRIISLDLSNSNLHGVISDNFTLLTELRFLDLSGNSMNGPIPDSLCERNANTFIFRYDFDKDMCNGTTSSSLSKKKTTIISIAVVVPMVIVVALVLSCLIWGRKRKPKISTHDPPRVPEPRSAPTSIKQDGDHLHNTENRRFTYKELEKITSKFKQSIGQGGFGLVYYGRLEDDTEVAVKMRSESSSHGLDEFLAEVNSLTKVHHRNLVSLVGYCWEKTHLALIYEYMARGSLCDQLRGKIGVNETLSWGTRVRIAIESAQGLDYLHKGCSLPIIHRDVKTNNILLDQNLRAKIADFGLCKTYLNDMQTHISTNAAGSAGYMDPEYYHTGWLTESSDVYSFGVVLLEVATGEPPMLPGHGHITQRVKQKIATGKINMVADPNLRGAYDINSMWKLVDTAMACTADAAIRRPTMAVVVMQLKESLALEESREDISVRGSFASTTGDPLSTFGPSAR
uniref:Uncharacterized protein n=1 Tax=Avena sativa TaxID=4498 RepID=A0ACD5XR32_AVESA